MNKENCALKLVDEIILYYDAPSKKHQMYDGFNVLYVFVFIRFRFLQHTKSVKLTDKNVFCLCDNPSLITLHCLMKDFY